MAITRRSLFRILLSAIVLCVALGVALRFRYATEIVRLRNDYAKVEVTDRWTGERMLCDLYGTYPTDCETEISFETPPREAATAPKLTAEQCKALESQHKGIPAECVFMEQQGSQTK